MSINATLKGPIAGAPVLQLAQYSLPALGYVVEEFFLSGTAASYELAGERGNDGRWKVRSAATAPFTTRLVACRPDKPTRFNGTVVVEWLNVSGGLDAPPHWYMMHRHALREGIAWVGVSAQIVGIEGGSPLGGVGIPLKQANRPRYAALSHPGDAFAYDIFTQAGQAAREPAGAGILGPLTAKRLIAVGTSQSAIFLVTYVNAVDRLAKTFDAFLVHGRGGNGAAIDGDFMRARTVNLSDESPIFSGAERIREDVRVPVLTIQSETDVLRLGGIGGRQPDAARVRLWEVAGAAHFDAYGLVASQFDDGTLPAARFAELNAPISEVVGMPTDLPINAGPQFHYVSQAAVAALDRWIRDGTPAAQAPRLELSSSKPARFALDEHGNVKGGIRTPWMDAPTATLSGLGQSGGGFAFLFGTTRPFDRAQLAALYPGGRREYLVRFEAATDEAVRAGFLLAADAPEIKALAAAACPLS